MSYTSTPAECGTTAKARRGCKCDECREAHNAYYRDYNKNRRDAFAKGDFEPQHGTARGYAVGCRCVECKVARFVIDLKADAVMYDEIIAAYRDQGGKCAICDDEVTRFHIDHDHATGSFRGILCGPCNTGLGMFHDRTELFDRAKQYLEKAERTL